MDLRIFSSLTRNWTHSWHWKAQSPNPLDHQGILNVFFFFKPRLMSFVFWRVLWSSFMSQLLSLQYTEGCFISYLGAIRMDWCFHLHPGWHSQMLGWGWEGPSVGRVLSRQLFQCVPCLPSQSCCWFTQDRVTQTPLWLSLGLLMALMTLVLRQCNWKVGRQLQSISPE